MTELAKRLYSCLFGAMFLLVVESQGFGADVYIENCVGVSCESCFEDPCCCGPGRADEVPVGSLSDDDKFLEGYLQALVDMHYYEYSVGVTVDEGDVCLSNLPSNCLLADSIMTFVGDHPCVNCVHASDVCAQGCHCDRCCPSFFGGESTWFPQNTVLWTPFIADPRQVTHSVSYRFHDQGTTDAAIAVSFGDQLPLKRWRNVWPWCGDLQIELEGGAWAVFDAETTSNPLFNADYFVSLPITYAVDCWAFRFRVWHMSSHLGDEFLVNNPTFQRRNVSREAVDFFVSHQLTCAIRLYGGVGWVFHEDEEYEREGVYGEYGVELRLMGSRDCCEKVYGTPFLAMHFRHWQDPVTSEYDNNRTYALGYEWSKLSGVGRKMRVFIEYHEGFSVEGQFTRIPTEYFALRLTYGF